MPMELQLLYADISIPYAIENIEALKAELQPKLEQYKNLVVTEDGIKSAKEDKANLNKLKKAVSEQRIACKKKCLEPYEAFEKECKELEMLIDEPINAMDDQIKAFAEKDKTEKFEKLKEAFDNTGHYDWLTLENVLPEKWANKTEKPEKLIGEIKKAVDRVNAEYAEITNMYFNSPLLTAIINKFIETKDKSATLVYATMLERQHEVQQKQSVQAEDDGRKITGAFRVTCTKQQLIRLRDFMRENQIEFEVVKG